MIAVELQSVIGMFVLLGSALFDLVASGTGLFSVNFCGSDSCPGSAYNSITAAWANIGYMTHADFVHFVWNTSFGLWAALLYAVGAAGALVAVSINQPPRTYMWFFLGPAVYAFLVGTPTTVQGVGWRIAHRDMDMTEVWRDAETGLANTTLSVDRGIRVFRNEAPSGTYDVAWTMVFLDGLFSETTNNLISWIGMQRREGAGGNDSNLFDSGGEEGPWHLLANLKWGMIENVVSVSARDPDVRDALVSFLSSECGDQFKKGVHSGAYSAASQARGATLATTVFVGPDPSSSSGIDDDVAGMIQYDKFVQGMDTEAIPTPRSLVRLLNSPNVLGSFRQFSEPFTGTDAYTNGRLTEIVCSEYLYTVIQAMRWEAGHAYHQLIRSFPNGFESAESALQTLFYGWNLRKSENDEMIGGDELVTYTKHLIFAHMIRNELMYAPQITEGNQRFAPSEQTRTHTEAYIRNQGSRAKYGELYNWAVMMPHVQGILTYLILIGYPFAAMLMVIPGYWKAFFTWVSFFAWVKLWDVGFAIVHTLERSVWAMIGNHSSMAAVGRRLINTAQDAGSDIDVTCPEGGQIAGRLSQLCAIPEVKARGGAQVEDNAWYTLDQILVVAGSLDLDLSNGYYIYIMAALYFAVPAVTGQLVLGAKASLGGLATQAIGQSAGEAGGAAKAGTQGERAQRLMTNQAVATQGGAAKDYRQSGLAQRSFDAQNAAMDADIRGAEVGIHQRGANAFADAGRDNLESIQAHGGFTNTTLNGAVKAAGLGAAGKKDSAAGPALKGGGDPSGSGVALGGGGRAGVSSTGFAAAGTASGAMSAIGRSGGGGGAGGGGASGGGAAGGGGAGGGAAGEDGGGGEGAAEGGYAGASSAAGGQGGGAGRKAQAKAASRAQRKAQRAAFAAGNDRGSAGGGYAAMSGVAPGSSGGDEGGGGVGDLAGRDSGQDPNAATMPSPGGAPGAGGPSVGQRATQLAAVGGRGIIAGGGWALNKGTQAALMVPSWGMAGLSNAYSQQYIQARARSNAMGLDFGMHKAQTELAKSGLQTYGQRLGQQGDFSAATAAWQTKRDFGNHLAGIAGAEGLAPAGGLTPGALPTDMAGMATSGALGRDAQRAAYYSGGGYMTNMNSMFGANRGKGSSSYVNSLQLMSFDQAVGAGTTAGVQQIPAAARLGGHVTGLVGAAATGNQQALENNPLHQGYQQQVQNGYHGFNAGGPRDGAPLGREVASQALDGINNNSEE